MRGLLRLHGVEPVAVQSQQAFSVRGLVDEGVPDLQVTEHHAVIGPEVFIVIARHVDDMRIVLCLSQDRSNHVVVVLRPVETASRHGPKVDNVAPEVEMLALGRTQEFQKVRGLAAPAAEVHVRDPDRAVPQWPHRVDRVHDTPPSVARTLVTGCTPNMTPKQQFREQL